MRIVAGQFKGRSIAAPKGRNTRPTGDRAREAVFNVLAHAEWAPPFENARVIDLFAGSGALGLEAMSRGATYALFVETDSAARGAIRDNIEAFGLFGSTRIQRRSATQLGDIPANIGAPFDLVFLDPPYNKDLVLPCLTALIQGGWLDEGATVIVETAVDESLNTSGWEILDTRDYGAAKVWFLRQN